MDPIIVTEQPSGFGRNFTIHSTRLVSNVEVSRRKRFGKTELEPAEINWPGCGNRDVEYTTEFTRMLLIAGVIAQTLNREPERTMEQLADDIIFVYPWSARFERSEFSAMIVVEVR